MIVDQAEALRGLVMEGPAEGRGNFARTVAVTSGKGGVGKTTVAVNLAIQLSQLGRRVVLLDADLGTANVDVICNLNPTSTIAHVVAGRRTLHETMVEGPGGFQLIPGASGLAQIANLSEFERCNLMQQMRRLESRADVVLIDTGAGVGANVLSFAVAADEALVVTTPEPTAITDAYAVIKTMHRQKPDVDVRVLVNMVRDEREGRAVFDRMSAVCRRFLSLQPRYAGYIVADPRVQASVRRRRPFVLDAPSCLASTCINQLAHRMDRHVTEPRQGGFLRRLAAWLSR